MLLWPQEAASIASARTEAEANAKVALMIAIGDLQKHTEADTRVTAPADIKDPNAPAVVGVWKNWEGSITNQIQENRLSRIGHIG